MPELVADCPRCEAKKHTFIVKTFLYIHTEYQWKKFYESCCVCKNCTKGTIFILSQKQAGSEFKSFFSDIQNLQNYTGSINQIMDIERYINIRNTASKKPPDYVPENIQKVFIEGSESFSGNCPNAAAAMFRLCVDLTTKDLLPALETPVEGLNKKVRNYLSDRLDWLFEQKILPNDLKEISECIRHDGNDGAHDGNLTKHDAETLLDFTHLLLERVYTNPEKARIAIKRREKRRNSA